MGKLVDKEIVLVRHGETDYNRKGIVQGRGVNSELNERGRAQAQAFFDHYSNHAFDYIFASTLTRTHQTMAPFVEAGYTLIKHAGLDEIDWGHHEGKGGDPKLAEEYQLILNRWKDGFWDAKIPGGESPLELQQRQREFIDTVLSNYEQKILICSHGRAIRSMLCTMLNMPLSQMDEFPHTNLSVYKLHQIGGTFKLVSFNDVAHLEQLNTAK
ncbi:histidine phosphatase family protein [soil metagenome]